MFPYVLLNNATQLADSENAFNNLYPAIIQCFAVILAGYFAGRVSLISGQQAKGIGSFVSNFALPALVLKSMIELDFSSINWMFLSCILFGKCAVFIIVVIFTLLLTRPVSSGIGLAGLYAIFATQSNDFALGYPVVQALYGKSNPEYLKYIYLVAPISFCIINPAGFLMLEFQKKLSAGGHVSKCAMFGHVIKGVFLNPIVFMTGVGIAGNFIFSGKVPVAINGILTVLSNAFSGPALFFLGLNLVGKIKSQFGLPMVVPISLVFAKMLIVPFMIRQFVHLTNAGVYPNETASLSTYGFLYGTFPPAPTVFLFASLYNTAMDFIASGLVIGTFLSAPLMFLAARLITLPETSVTDVYTLLWQTSFDISILSLICVIWVAGVLMLSRRWRNIPHQFVFFFLIAQFMTCVGMIIQYIIDDKILWQHYLQFITFLVGTLGTRCSTAMLAAGLAMLRCRSLCFVLRMKVWMVFYIFGLPILMTGLLLMVASDKREVVMDPQFQYGLPQIIISDVCLFVNLFINIFALVYQHRHDRLHLVYSKLKEEVENEKQASNSDGLQATMLSNNRGSGDNKSPLTTSINCDNCECDDTHIVNFPNIEDLVPNPPRSSNYALRKSNSGSFGDSRKLTSSLHDRQRSESDCSTCDTLAPTERTCLVSSNCTAEQRRICLKRLHNYDTHTQIGSGDEMVEEELLEYQITRHLVLILLMTASMLFGVAICIWRLFETNIKGVGIELQFLDAVFNFGQGFFAFVVFGLDTKLVIMPFVQRWRRLIYGVEEIYLPPEDDLDNEVKTTCKQFVKYHIKICQEEIVRDKRYRLRVYKGIFSGSDLVDWLLKVGLASDRVEAIAYGQRLLIGRVIYHVTREHFFYDMLYFYRLNEEKIPGGLSQTMTCSREGCSLRSPESNLES